MKLEHYFKVFTAHQIFECFVGMYLSRIQWKQEEVPKIHSMYNWLVSMSLCDAPMCKHDTNQRRRYWHTSQIFKSTFRSVVTYGLLVFRVRDTIGSTWGIVKHISIPTLRWPLNERLHFFEVVALGTYQSAFGSLACCSYWGSTVHGSTPMPSRCYYY